MGSNRNEGKKSLFHLICQGKYSFLYFVIVPVVDCMAGLRRRISFFRGRKEIFLDDTAEAASRLASSH